jgi:predicted RNA-binding protein YlxR (DUF448 family)
LSIVIAGQLVDRGKYIAESRLCQQKKRRKTYRNGFQLDSNRSLNDHIGVESVVAENISIALCYGREI